VKDCIATKGDRWYAVVYEGLGPVTGRERRTWHPGGSSRDDAEELAARLAKEVNGRNDKDWSLTCGTRLTGVVAQPPGLFVIRSALEPVDIVAGFDEPRWPMPVRHSSTNGDGRCISSRNPGRSRARRLLTFSHACRESESRTNSDRSANARRAATVRFVTTNSVRSVP